MSMNLFKIHCNEIMQLILFPLNITLSSYHVAERTTVFNDPRIHYLIETIEPTMWLLSHHVTISAIFVTGHLTLTNASNIFLI